MTRSTVTPAELRALTTTAGGKYHARKTWVEEIGRFFASQHEADAAVTLWRRRQAGEIRHLEFQPRFDLRVNGVHVCRYVADFQWAEPRTLAPWATGNPCEDALTLWDVIVVADAKSPPTKTAVYRLKKKLMSAVLGIEIVEL